jgi:uncharacterized alkaline shock family protein YloU
MHELEDNSRSALVYRFIIGSFFLALSGGVAFVLLVAVQAVKPSQIFGSWPYAQSVLSFLDGLDWTSRLSVAAVSVLVGMLSITILFRLFTKPETPAELHILDADDRGIVVVDSRGISTIAAQAAMSAHGVVDVHVSTKGTGTTPVRLRVDAAVYPGANVKRAASEVREAVREAVETLVGIGVRDVSVNAHVIQTDALASLIK